MLANQTCDGILCATCAVNHCTDDSIYIANEETGEPIIAAVIHFLRDSISAYF